VALNLSRVGTPLTAERRILKLSAKLTLAAFLLHCQAIYEP